MPTFSTTPSRDYYESLRKKRQTYKKTLIAKGVIDGSTKMLKLMCKKRF